MTMNPFDMVDTDAIFAGLQNDSNQIEAPVAATPVSPESKPTESTSTTDAKPSVQTEDVRIPKARLDSEIGKRKAIEAQLAKASQELEALRKSGGSSQQNRSEDLDDLFGDSKSSELHSKIAQLENWKSELDWQNQVSATRKELDNQVSEIRKEHPSVPDKVLYTAVIQNPEVDLWVVAENYGKWVSEIEAKAIERHTAAGGLARPTAVARPHTIGSPQVSTVGTTAPQTMEEAAERTLAMFG